MEIHIGIYQIFKKRCHPLIHHLHLYNVFLIICMLPINRSLVYSLHIIQWNGSAVSSRMQYFLRDHLGSVRVIAEDRHTVIRTKRLGYDN